MTTIIDIHEAPFWARLIFVCFCWLVVGGALLWPHKKKHKETT